MKHRILILGVGSIGERHVRCFLQTGRVEVGIVETHADLRHNIAKRYGIKQYYEKLDDALGEKWHSSVIATPAHTHLTLAQRLADAAISSFIEKPLDVSLDRLNALLTTVKTNNLIMGVAYIHRSHPALFAMRQAIVDGRFGQPLHIVATGGQHFPSHRPAYASTYYRDHVTGGGAIQDALTHIINAAEWLVGPITRLSADAMHQRLADIEVEDTVNLIARHGEVMASYTLNQHQAPNELQMTVVCENGTVRYEPLKHQWGWCDEPNGPWHIDTADLKERDDWFTHQAHAWLDVIENKQTPRCTLEQAAQTLRVNLAALRSVRHQGQWQNL